MYTRLISFFLFSCAAIEALVVNDLEYQAQMKPGEQTQVRFSIVNEKDEPEEVELKQSDYGCNSEGQHFFDDPGVKERSNAPWIQLGSQRLTLAPKEKADIVYTIKVPETVSHKGSYSSLILIEPVQPLRTIEEAKEGFKLNVKVRFAYHVVTDIEGGTPKLKITKREFKQVNDKTMLCVDVENNGELFLKPKLFLKLYNSQGKLEKTLQAGALRLYPGSSQRYYLNPESIEPMKYKAFLLLDNGDHNLFGETFDLAIQSNN